MNVLTKREAIRKHRKMWNWIAETSKKRKKKATKLDYLCEKLRNNNFERCLRNYCFCCEYVSQAYVDKQFPEGESGCCFCPINWGGEATDYMCEIKSKFDDDNSNLFALWDALPLNNYREAAKLAQQIANLPERKALTILDVATELCDGLPEKADHIPFIIKGLQTIMKEDGITLKELNELCWNDSNSVFDRICS